MPKAQLKHALSNVTDNFSICLLAMLLVTFACECPGLHDEGGDFSRGEHGHSFILVTFTSARGCVECDMMVQMACGAVWWMFVVGILLLVDKSVSVGGGLGS
jgi:hypothetical protein